MQRIDVVQAHRGGVLALMRRLPFQPGVALLLDCATRRSMRWLLNVAGVPTGGLRGELRVRGLCGVWLWAMRAWRRDETDDMSATMSAVDDALRRIERFAPWLGGGTARSVRQDAEPEAEPEAEPDAEPPPEVPSP